MAIARHKTRRRELREARDLAGRAQRGEPRAFELLYAAYEGRVYRFCHRLTGDAEVATALVELTFVRAVADLPGDAPDTLDVPAHLLSTARVLAYERQGASQGHDLPPGEVAAAHQRLSPQERAALALRDLEGRPDAEIAGVLGTGEPAVAGLVGTARLRLHAELGLPAIAAACPGRLPELSAYADDTLPAERRTELEQHVTDCAHCRAALFALRDATLRYRSMPVPEPPGELDSRIAAALGAAGFPARTAEAAEPAASGGRRTAVAVAMAILALVGVGVTIAAAGDDDGGGTSAPSLSPDSPRPEARASLPSSALAVGAAAGAVSSRPRLRRPPVLHHERSGRRLAARAVRHPKPPSVAQTLGLGRSFAPSAPPVVAPPPPQPAAPPPPGAKPKPRPARQIPVEILSPPQPSQAQAASDASGGPSTAAPPAPPAPPPAQTTST
jgi:DNA-directed RNA polymerase specialized sigma24 family protein/anti-sigma factor RsiW